MDSSKIDETHIEMISHISIRDPDTGEIILRQRDTKKAIEDE